jgi:FkbM family methyltransferase
MKFKELFYILGFRPRSVAHGYRVERLELPDDGTVEYAHWLYHKDGEAGVSEAEVAELRQFLRAGDFAIDIGAHIGDTTLPMALACGVQGLVLAFEPNPFVYEVLVATSRLNPAKTNIVPLPYAVTERPGRFVFRYSDSSYANGGQFTDIPIWRHGHSFPLEVEGRPLQPLLAEQYTDRLPRLRYIKIDVEGNELSLLRSIEHLIATHRPFLRLEVYKHAPEQQRRDMFRFIAGHGYAIHRADNGIKLFGEPLGETDVMRWRHYDIFAVPQ